MAEGLGGSARSWGVERWRWKDGGGSVCDERDRRAAAAELAGDGEEGFPPSLADRGGTGGVLGGCLSAWMGSGTPIYRWTRSVPAAAVDKNAGDRRSVAAERRGGDERLPTSLRMSSSCSRGQLARAGGLGGAVHGRGLLPTPACRQGSPDGGTVGRQGGLEGSGEWARPGRGPAGEQRPGARRGDPCARTCKTRALGAPRTRTLHARQYAKAC